ncbi:hypothetical protein B0H11DRAFT_1938033 [Mycena galericulata]|nr:hypothetical protein B0H11DRAFT_1938033 [Mycena galericulata]
MCTLVMSLLRSRISALPLFRTSIAPFIGGVLLPNASCSSFSFSSMSEVLNNLRTAYHILKRDVILTLRTQLGADVQLSGPLHHPFEIPMISKTQLRCAEKVGIESDCLEDESAVEARGSHRLCTKRAVGSGCVDTGWCQLMERT